MLCPQKCFIIHFLLSTSSSRCCWAAPLHLGQAEDFASPPDFHHTLGVWAITQQLCTHPVSSNYPAEAAKNRAANCVIFQVPFAEGGWRG